LIAVDSNVLIYAHRAELAHHQLALRRLSELAQSAEPWAIPVFCVGEFLRVVTHPRMFKAPHSPHEAADSIRRLLAAPTVRLLTPGPRFTPLLLAAIEETGAKGNLVFDAQIVALCREAGVRALLSEDRDFDRFRGFPTLRLTADI
jgi:uncharacterized protein